MSTPTAPGLVSLNPELEQQIKTLQEQLTEERSRIAKLEADRGQLLILNEGMQSYIHTGNGIKLPDTAMYPGNRRAATDVVITNFAPLSTEKSTRAAFDAMFVPLGLILLGCTLWWDEYALQVLLPARPIEKNNKRHWEPIAHFASLTAQDNFSRAAIAGLYRYFTACYGDLNRFDAILGLQEHGGLYHDARHLSYCLRSKDASVYINEWSFISSGYAEEKTVVGNKVVSDRTKRFNEQQEKLHGHRVIGPGMLPNHRQSDSVYKTQRM